MPVLKNFTHFVYTHPEIGVLASVLTHRMETPISEALLFGVSGGIVTGYHLTKSKYPKLNLITHNPFNPLDTVIERLKLSVDDRRTSHPDRAYHYLHEALEYGYPVIVWVDSDSLSYTLSDEKMIRPLVVYGYDEQQVYIADRALCPIIISAHAFETARSKAISEGHRQLTVDEPNTARLALAVRLGIESCLRDFLEEPPIKALRGKFGLVAYDYWADLLDADNDSGWHKQYPRGRKLLSMLVSAYRSIHFSANGGRSLFADFLDEAANLLDKPMLNDNAEHWRDSLVHWENVKDALLSVDVSAFREIRDLLQRDHDAFLRDGFDALPEREKIQADLHHIMKSAGRKFPIKKSQTDELLDNLRERIITLHQAESHAVYDLRDVMLPVRV